MLWRTYLLHRLVWTRDIRFIVWRHPVVYAKVLIQFAALFLVLFLLQRVNRFWVPEDIMQIVFGSLIWLWYIVAIYMLLRSYFDIMVATNSHLYIVFWDSFYKYRIKIITRSAIQDISVYPANSLSAIFKDWHVSIATEQDEVIEFRHVYQASKVASDIYSIRDMHKSWLHSSIQEAPIENYWHHVDDEKFKVLVETLWEVIVDYMKKKE